VVGLTWLRPGANRFGSARDNDVIMPAPVAAHAGSLVLDGRVVRLEVPGAPPRALRTDADANVDTLKAGTVSWQVIARGDRFGVRVRDSAGARHKSFAGCVWFPIDPAFRVVAHLTPREGPADMVVPDAAGGKQTLKSPGTLSFILGGKPQHLDPVLDGDDSSDQLVVFRDLTSAHETYGGGRFVRALRQADGAFVVDFNRAYSPPCALTPYATCPLPPPQNRLDLRVEAGERVDAKTDAQSHKSDVVR
jgi:uncharacterized protein (DUF1684 family)